jgi:hypothetical protein
MRGCRKGIENHVIDPASIAVSRRKRQDALIAAMQTIATNKVGNVLLAGTVRPGVIWAEQYEQMPMSSESRV